MMTDSQNKAANETDPAAGAPGEVTREAAVPPPADVAAATTPQTLLTNVTCSRGFAQWLQLHNTSLAFTSYQTGQLFLVGVRPDGALSLHQRNFVRAMGLIGDQQTLLLAGLAQIWRFENALGPDQRANEHFDRLYVPRRGQTVADLDAHELGIDSAGRLLFVSTKYSCLATDSGVHSFKPVWRPPFISRLAPEDRCHLNGLAMDKGVPRYMTSVSTTDVVDGWRNHRRDGGVVVDVETDAILAEGLSMPHSPRVYRGAVWVLDSGNGYLTRIDPESGTRERVAFCPGFSRGLSFHDGHALVGLSLPRHEGVFSGLALQEELEARRGEAWCGVQIINTQNGDIVEWLRLEGAVRELFDVRFLPGVQCPMALPTFGPELASFITIEAPDRPLSERGWHPPG
ncbi:TIGR03032 family protein [Acuticoccus sp. M5D2P5]|uniref:TIGR03032 family protein n=1 Tax=Acuticoccus kalidii TaxID=2910977 RepID=UPI001F31F5F6|nr:TIGR03032 family protein [Acuticoccus kalidii]MCF3935263.1 TIGR03032 family protein [Acuticoccus kalidii]